MRILAISDLHGHMPDNLPACDVLVVAGDICPDNAYTRRDAWLCSNIQAKWVKEQWLPWVESQNATHIVAIWGNHDFVGLNPDLIDDDSVVYWLQDSGVTLEGKRFWGSPWVTGIPGWAFNKTSTRDHWEYMPDNIDVLITHAPPYGLGDEVSSAGHVGDKDLAAVAFKKTKYHFFGHIHEGVGAYDDQHPLPKSYNVAYVDEYYEYNNMRYRLIDI